MSGWATKGPGLQALSAAHRRSNGSPRRAGYGHPKRTRPPPNEASAAPVGMMVTMNSTSAGHAVTIARPAEDEPEATASCSCGWASEVLWSRRRAHEAGADHLRATRSWTRHR